MAFPQGARRHAARHAKIPQMEPRDAGEMLAKIRSLPAAGPLLERLGDHPGVYLVGGAVRDLLIGTEPKELDLVVEGDASEFANQLDVRPRVHDRFGTSTAFVNGFTYDIAQARRESYERPGALPQVTPATVDEDLRRRDFTVNAMAIALTGRNAGELHKAEHAREDLDARLLRVLHDRSFIDDPTRLLRLVRYAARLGFKPEPHTNELLEAAVATGALTTVSGSRIGAELRLLAGEDDPIAGFGCLREHRLDQAIAEGFGLADPALAAAALSLAPADSRRDLIVLAAASRHTPRLSRPPPPRIGWPPH